MKNRAYQEFRGNSDATLSCIPYLEEILRALAREMEEEPPPLIQELCPCMVLVLCGLPGSGKTTLARQLTRDTTTQPVHQQTTATTPCCIEVRHLCFDDVFVLEAGDQQLQQDEAAVMWRQARQQSLAAVERLVEESMRSKCCNQRMRALSQLTYGPLGPPLTSAQVDNGRRRLVVVDDNMYYRSMRHQCYEIAKKRSCCTAHTFSLMCNTATHTHRERERDPATNPAIYPSRPSALRPGLCQSAAWLGTQA